MPEISRFFGVVIKMFFDDHNPPHFHAEYAGKQMVVAIDSLAVIGGRLTPRATALVMEWGALRQRELQAAWQQARSQQVIDTIDPLP